MSVHVCVVREPRSAFPMTHCWRRAFAISGFRGAGQRHHFKAGARAPRKLAPRLSALVLCQHDLQAGLPSVRALDGAAAPTLEHSHSARCFLVLLCFPLEGK